MVSGGNLLGVRVLPEGYRQIGFPWKLGSGKCFRIERRAFYVKASHDRESQIIPLQSRDYTALAGHDNVCDNLGNPYPCITKDLDYPVK